MRNIELNEMKTIELDLLKKIDKICRDNNFRYSIAYGTLLGAVRHKGFIPWDDDIDICMPKPDYEKFIEFCKNNDVSFECLAKEKDCTYYDLISKICAKNTIIVEKNAGRYNLNKGVFVDIFPMEGLGKTKKQAVHNFNKSVLWREILNAASWTKFFRSNSHAIYLEPIRFFFYIISRFIHPSFVIKKINKIYDKGEYDSSEYVGVLGSPYRKKDILEKKFIEEYDDVLFEGIRVRKFKNYDWYLKHFYGNYMKLPPIEKQITHHSFQAYYIENEK